MKMAVLWISVILVFSLLLIYLIYFFQEKFIFYPQKLNPSFKFSFRQPFQERFFQTADRVRIHALHFKVKDPKGLIYYLHGNAGSLQGWGAVAENFTPYHFDVLMIDYRGYGKSSGRISEKGLLKDAMSVYDSLTGEYAESRILVYGRSLGTGIACYVASKSEPGMLVLESPYYSIPDAAKSHFPWFPTNLIRYRFRNDLYLKKTRCPVYIFHGTEDEVLDIKGCLKLKPFLKAGDEMYLIEGGHHNDLALYPEYREKLQKILIHFSEK